MPQYVAHYMYYHWCFGMRFILAAHYAASGQERTHIYARHYYYEEKRDNSLIKKTDLFPSLQCNDSFHLTPHGGAAFGLSQSSQKFKHVTKTNKLPVLDA